MMLILCLLVCPNSFHKDLHLIVCVHGLDGNSADLRLIRTYLELGLPMENFQFLMSQSNYGETFDSLDVLTTRLIEEIENYVSTYSLKPTRLRLVVLLGLFAMCFTNILYLDCGSFISHSLGCILCRAVISNNTFRKRWQGKFHTFLSLSGPHLGLAYNRSGLVSMGKIEVISTTVHGLMISTLQDCG